jgi:hypothetical protein
MGLHRLVQKLADQVIADEYGQRLSPNLRWLA